jgi:hypothetical protein
MMQPAGAGTGPSIVRVPAIESNQPGAGLSIFEFVLTGFTLVLALVITRLLGGLRWVWYARGVDWTYLSFAYNLLVGPGILFFTASVLVPDNPRRIRDWRAHYFRTRKMFFGAFGVLVAVLVLGSFVYTGTPLLHFTRLIQLAALAVCAIGYVSTRHSVHATIAVLLSVLMIVLVVYSETAGGLRAGEGP